MVSCVVYLTIRLLVAGASTGTTKLLGLAAARIGNQQAAVIVDQNASNLLLGGLIDKLLMEGDDGLGDCLADG